MQELYSPVHVTWMEKESQSSASRNGNKSKDSRNPQNKGFGYAKYTGLGIQMVIVILFGVFGSLKLDQYLHTLPVFTLLGAVISVSAALYIGLKDFLKK